MTIDKSMFNPATEGFHGTFRVTPVTIASGTRVEVPAGGIAAQLYRRKSVILQNTSSGTVWVGDRSVGYGTTAYGGGAEATCSGIKIVANGQFEGDIGRAEMWVFNENNFAAPIKLLEIS